MKFAVLILLSILLPFHSCSSHKDMGANQLVEGHNRLYTFPEKKEEYFHDSSSKDQKEIVFAVINDFRGNIEAKERIVHDPSQNKKFTIRTGGITGHQTYLDILREKFPGQVAVVNSGSLFDPNKIPDETLFYLNTLDADVTGLSRTDFSLPYPDNYMQRLDELFAKSASKVVSSNLFNLASAEEFSFKNIFRSTIVETNGVKIGYLSLVSPALAESLDKNKVNKIYFQPMASKIITLSNDLRKKGAQVVALMVSGGIDCTSLQSQAEGISEKKVNFHPTTDKVCDLYKNELSETLKKLPPGLVDIVFSNGIDSKVANIINGYPVLQNYYGAEYLGWAKIVVNTKHNQVVRNKTQIMQPVQLCHQFFEETEDCYSAETLRNIELAPARFLGTKVQIKELTRR